MQLIFSIVLSLFVATSLLASTKPKGSTLPSELKAPIPIIHEPDHKLTASGQAFLPPGMYEALPPTDRSIVMIAGRRWPNPKAVNFCWVNPEQGQDIVSDFQGWLTTEYAKAGIGFQFTGKCSNFSQDFQIRAYLKPVHQCLPRITASGGGLSYIGPVNAQLGGVEGIGTLNVAVCKDVKSYPNGQSNTQWFIDYERATITHETGHAMGLAHEQERQDAPVCQDQRGTIPNGGDYFYVTKYDEDSIMNYCKNPRNPNHLSALDIVGLNYLYPNKTTTNAPQPQAYTMRIKATGKCLDVAGNSTANGAMVQQYDCNGTSAQLWTVLDGGNGTWTIKGVNSQKCLDVWGLAKQDGARIYVGNCNGGNNQKFKPTLRAGGYYALQAVDSQRCMDIDLKGSYLQQWSCNPAGQDNQSFGFVPVGSLPSALAAPIVSAAKVLQK